MATKSYLEIYQVANLFPNVASGKDLLGSLYNYATAIIGFIYKMGTLLILVQKWYIYLIVSLRN